MTSYFLVWHLIDSTSSKFFTAFFFTAIRLRAKLYHPPKGKEIPIGTLVCFLKRKFPCVIPTGNFWILYRNFPIFFKLKSLWGEFLIGSIRPAEKKTLFDILTNPFAFASFLKCTAAFYWKQKRFQFIFEVKDVPKLFLLTPFHKWNASTLKLLQKKATFFVARL